MYLFSLFLVGPKLEIRDPPEKIQITSSFRVDLDETRLDLVCMYIFFQFHMGFICYVLGALGSSLIPCSSLSFPPVTNYSTTEGGREGWRLFKTSL